jgi:hypothetical protein
MVGRPPAARKFTIRRGYEFARLQQQLLSLAYEHLLPIVRPQTQPAAAASRPTRPHGDTGCRPMNMEVHHHAAV